MIELLGLNDLIYSNCMSKPKIQAGETPERHPHMQIQEAVHFLYVFIDIFAIYACFFMNKLQNVRVFLLTILSSNPAFRVHYLICKVIVTITVQHVMFFKPNLEFSSVPKIFL